MRIVLGLLAALVLGVVLATGSAIALVSVKNPDAKPAQELHSGTVSEPNAVVYGQR